MPFHDLCDVGLRADPIPHSLWIDHDARTQLAVVQAAGFIGANKAFEIQPFCLTLEMRVKFFRAQACATPARVVFGTLVRTDKDVPLKGWHTVELLYRHGEGVEPFHQQRHIAVA